MTTYTETSQDTSIWPIIGSIALLVLAVGAVNWLHGHAYGPYLFGLGCVLVAYQLYGWFAELFQQERLAPPTALKNLNYRHGMLWFIFSEFMFFGAFFAALFYARLISVPDLGAMGSPTHLLLWPDFSALWPLTKTPDPDIFNDPNAVVSAWHIPVFSTLILLAADMVLAYALIAINKGKRHVMLVAMSMAFILTALFLTLQIVELIRSYDMGLTLSAGIYGATFISLTGVHGLHIVVGLIMLAVIIKRGISGDFAPGNHFAVSAVSWYWHFLDALWIAMFVFVYWL